MDQTNIYDNKLHLFKPNYSQLNCARLNGLLLTEFTCLKLNSYRMNEKLLMERRIDRLLLYKLQLCKLQ